MNTRLAILDDEPRLAEVLALVLRRDGHQVETFSDPATCLAALADDFDLLITDLKMPLMSGLEVLRAAKAQRPELPVVLITAHATVQTAIEAIREGAYDYVQKPFDNDACRRLVARALEVTQLARENRRLRAQLMRREGLDQVIAESPAMRAALDLAGRAARSDATVLITGESGTGKEVIARAVHARSDRVGGPFVAVNCKAFAAGVVESELFGHERGAFTGADRARVGLFERADGGTLFLDEIGEVGDDFQAKLLRVLQEREVQRVGGAKPRPVNVRVLAATHRDLPSAIASGRFRQDLYFRLAVIPVHLPPLRERPADVLPLARFFFERACDRQGRALVGWTAPVEAWMVGHDWPGNVRELENTIERGVVLARDDRVTLADLLVHPTSPDPDAASAPESLQGGLQATLDAAAAHRIRAALRAAQGVRVDAARALEVDRTTLYRLMQKYGID